MIDISIPSMGDPERGKDDYGDWYPGKFDENRPNRIGPIDPGHLEERIGLTATQQELGITSIEPERQGEES